MRDATGDGFNSLKQQFVVVATKRNAAHGTVVRVDLRPVVEVDRAERIVWYNENGRDMRLTLYKSGWNQRPSHNHCVFHWDVPHVLSGVAQTISFYQEEHNDGGAENDSIGRSDTAV